MSIATVRAFARICPNLARSSSPFNRSSCKFSQSSRFLRADVAKVADSSMNIARPQSRFKHFGKGIALAGLAAAIWYRWRKTPQKKPVTNIIHIQQLPDLVAKNQISIDKAHQLAYNLGYHSEKDREYSKASLSRFTVSIHASLNPNPVDLLAKEVAAGKLSLKDSLAAAYKLGEGVRIVECATENHIKEIIR
ncbi:MAG: hypothetical protein ACOYK9_05015 [Chlamydiia bacterium]